MTIYQIREVLAWCSVINVALLIFMFLVVTVLRPVVYKMHSKLFPITEAQFNVSMYAFIGAYKLLVFMFNIIPYIALSIVGN